ncbi:MAG: ABC-ATPase domain-containing protein [Bacillota bacterium]|nr:ABC-ATPase domain-containing protein [Bacillota bacterium]
MSSGQERLSSILRRIDHRGYKAYQDIRGQFRFPGFDLYVDHVQADPFAPPSRFRVRVLQSMAGFPEWSLATPGRRVALADFLARRFSALAAALSHGHGQGAWESESHSHSHSPGGSATPGTGKSGRISMARPGQEILPRNSVLVDADFVEARFTVGLPAAGRSILGRVAEDIICGAVPRLVRDALLFASIPVADLERHIETAEDSDALRAALPGLEIVAFVANGAVLPRRSGVDDRPLDSGNVVPFTSPSSLEVEVTLPNRGPVRGMGVPRGVTLIVGGGYHGKSTLLRAIERGVYNHIPGDGRELVVTSPLAVKIRAEDGRAVTEDDISFFITNLPFGADTRHFSTENASGSTSQAANIVEAIEAGAKVLLVDEDTSATNFMIRDRRMQALVAKDREPITPFIDRVRSLAEDGISTVLVLGGSGDYLDVADTVIMMDEYRPVDVTARAREVAAHFATGRKFEGGEDEHLRPARRVPVSLGFARPGDRRPARTKARGTDAIVLGHEEIDLRNVEQVVDPGQTRFIADALRYLEAHLLDGRTTVPDLIAALEREIAAHGMDVVAPFVHGDYCLARPIEITAALNRLRTLKVSSKPRPDR